MRTAMKRVQTRLGFEFTDAKRLAAERDYWGPVVKASGFSSVTPITMATLHCGCIAPVVNHLRPLIT